MLRYSLYIYIHYAYCLFILPTYHSSVGGQLTHRKATVPAKPGRNFCRDIQLIWTKPGGLGSPQ